MSEEEKRRRWQAEWDMIAMSNAVGRTQAELDASYRRMRELERLLGEHHNRRGLPAPKLGIFGL